MNPRVLHFRLESALQMWVEQVEPHESLVACMLQTLTECVPECKTLVQGDAWKNLKVDLADPCFMPPPEEAMREERLKFLRQPLILGHSRKSQ